MLPVPFSFGGRLARWPFFLANLALMGACAIPGLLALGALPAIRSGSSPALIGLAVMLGIVALAIMWVSFALQARRFRDLGISPWLAIPGWIALGIADPALAHLVPALSMGREHGHTLPGAMLNAAIVLALLLWPSADETEAPAASRRQPTPSRLLPIGPVPVLVPVRAAKSGLAHAAFGRR